MDDWYRYYRAEINRREDEIKTANRHRLMELAKNDPYGTPAPKAYKRLFSALGAWLSHWGAPKEDQAPAPRSVYGQE